jgi:hypothetical protein
MGSAILSQLYLTFKIPLRRDQAVLATKFTFNAQKGNPNAGGNDRKISIAL